MAGRFRGDDQYPPRPGNYHTNSSNSIDGRYQRSYDRNHERAQSEHPPRNEQGRVPRTLNSAYTRRRHNSLNAFVEDERDALAREHNPASAGLLSAGDDEPIQRGDVDQIPILMEVVNPERRFVLIPKAPTVEPEAKAADGNGRGHGSVASSVSSASRNSKTSHDSTGSPSTITATASTITSTESTITPTGSPSTPTGPSSSSYGGIRTPPASSRQPDKVSEYEANTCRKFTVPRIDSESASSGSTATEPSKIRSDKDGVTATASQHRPSLSTAAGLTAAAAAAAAVAAATTATSSKAKPEIKRRKSRLDLPRIDTDMQHDNRAHSTNSGRPRSPTPSEYKTRDRHNDSRDSREGLGDRNGHRDNDFLSPTFIKHTTNGRDRAYFEQASHGQNSNGESDSGRARSGDSLSSHSDWRSHDRDERSSISDSSIKRRSTSFSETGRLSRKPSYKRISRDEGADSRAGRKSPSPPPKSRTPTSPQPRTDKRPSSPPRNRERERDRERDRDRERGRDGERDRVKERDRERDREREREREREKERDKEREREKERDRRLQEQDRDRQKPVRRDSIPIKRRDSMIRPGDGFSDERSKRSSANTPLRRQNSERRRPSPPLHKDDESVVSKASSNPNPRRTSAIDDPGINDRYRSANSTPLATPKQSGGQFPFMAGSPPKELFEATRPVSPRRRDDRRPGSSSSPSSSPESRSRNPHEGDRPRGPRPRATQHPNVVHNPATASMPNLQSAPKASTLPMPISLPIPIPALSPGRADSLRDHDAPARQERERSPVDSLRSSRISLNSNPLPPRSSAVFGHGPNSSPSYRQPAFFINIPSTAADDEIAVDVQIVTGGGPREWYPERPPAATRQGAERPPVDRAEKPLVPLYKRYAEDVYSGRVAGLPECPRIQFSTKYRDWRTLTPYKDFLICPTCYDAGFARTQWRNEFVPVTGIDPKLKTNCIYGAMPWYQVAFFFVRAFQMPTLSLLRTMFNRDEELRLPCPGPRRIAGRWFTIQDPLDGRPVSKFTTCEQCATAITVLFPRLKGLLQDNNPTPHDTTNVCSLYYEPERKRLWKFIDVLESTNNASMVNNAPVDVNEFINKILDITHYEECKRDIPVRQRKWYWMRTMPDFVVCQECFDEVVYPVVTTYRGVAGDFYKEPKELDIAACHLYSQRMRDIFKRACQNNDKEYLAKKLEERADVAADITARIQRLPKASSADDVEQMKLMAEWKKWE